jgi:hypothetical protein
MCVLWGITEERDHWEDLGLNRRKLFKWILKEWNGKAWAGLI